MGLYGYVWEWDGEDAQGNKWRKFDPKLQECSTRRLFCQTGKEVHNMGKYDANLNLMNQTNKATGYKRASRKLPAMVVSRPDLDPMTFRRRRLVGQR